jgi:hypothetical protein
MQSGGTAAAVSVLPGPSADVLGVLSTESSVQLDLLVPDSSGLSTRLCACRYKDRAAQRADWKRGHMFECNALESARENGISVPAAGRLVARVLWRKLEECKQLDAAKQPSFWHSFASVAALQSHWDDFTEKKQMGYMRDAQFIGCA